jgi:DNA-binding NtrC family response regulator
VAVAAGLAEQAPLSLRLASGRGKSDSEAPGPALELSLPPAAWSQLQRHGWPGNLRELEMVMHNLVAFTLVAAADALEAGVPVSSPRLQVDPGLVGQLLSGSQALTSAGHQRDSSAGRVSVKVTPGRTLNQVAQDVERQYLRQLFERTRGDFAQMAELLLGDASRTRAVRLRLNQLGLKVRELRGE